MSATANGIWFMSGFAVGPNRVLWDALPQTLVDLSLTDKWQHMVDSTVVRTHSQATGAKGESFRGFWSLTRRLYEQNPCPM
ncbi:hypothetical protein [Acetobacter thailandicus]|uniref:Transposase n=1 Tax=Acetobacter thailandicus TaxID=1502842 RepID=A0ABT3QHC7_9PROT|nr:hypothetical protein [Acetobacter thailandicus]MCX2564689.1 hypothetical protein [Acetobacter thailandicus]